MTRKTETTSLKSGSAEWNDEFFLNHSTSYVRISDKMEQRVRKIYKINSQFHQKNKRNIILEMDYQQGVCQKFSSQKLPESKFYGPHISKITSERVSKVLPSEIVLDQNDILQTNSQNILKFSTMNYYGYRTVSSC